MNVRKLLTATVFSTLLFTGCAHKSDQEAVDISKYKDNQYKASVHQNDSLQNIKKYNTSSNKNTTNVKNTNNSKKFTFNQKNTQTSKKVQMNENLFDFYSDWAGTKYRLGGTSKKGIDCSGFVQKALKEKFDLQVPRSARDQAQVGQNIKKDDLQMGDLVFFKTGRSNHVGIYIENGKFMHASTSIGVTISKLDNQYFAKNYWKAQRVLK